MPSESTTDEYRLTEEECYQFDLDGYLVLEDVLSDSEVAELNRLIDAQDLPQPSQGTDSGRVFGGFLEWGKPFRELLDHEEVLRALGELLGDGFRLDHYYGIYLEKGAETLPLHGGGTPYEPAEYYHYQNGSMYNGLTVVGWNLRDTGPDSGGFCCIPGSHKANYECPQRILEAVSEADTLDELPDSVVVPEVSAGSVVIFTEALTHGTAPWIADYQRRSLLYKYSPGHLSWGLLDGARPDDADLTPHEEKMYTGKSRNDLELTPRQEKLLEPPYVHHRASLFEDE